MIALDKDYGMSAGGFVGDPDSFHLRIFKDDDAVEIATFNAAGNQAGHIRLSRAVARGFAAYILDTLKRAEAAK